MTAMPSTWLQPSSDSTSSLLGCQRAYTFLQEEAPLFRVPVSDVMPVENNIPSEADNSRDVAVVEGYILGKLVAR